MPALGKHSCSENRGRSHMDREQINCYLRVGRLLCPFYLPPGDGGIKFTPN
jgi:hypothetical protein